jgi:hypothetical protein
LFKEITMGILIAIVVFVAGSVGSAAKDGLFKKGADSTRRDTYAFERHALETNLARVETKQRTVVELNGTDARSAQLTAQLNTKETRLQERITALKQAEEKMDAPRAL